MSVSIGKLLLPNATSRVLLTSLLAGSLAFAGCGPDDGNNGGADTGADVQMDTGDAGMDTGDTESDGDAGEVEEGDPAALAIAPGLQDFGTVSVGETSSSASFTVTNDGDLDSSPLSVELSGTDSADFDLASNDCDGTTLAGGDTCTVDVTFTPSASGDLAADLVVSADEGGEVTATLEGTGAEPGALAISPTPSDFGTVVVGQSSDVTDFTVENTGETATGDLTASLTGGASNAFEITDDQCSGSPLDASATCTISIEFAPATTGDKSTTLRVVSADSDIESTADLSGVAVQDAKINVSPSAQNFGSVVINESSSDVAFTIENTGGVETGSLGVSVTGTDASEFTKGTDNCDGQTLSAGETCTVSMTFDPTTSGDKSATLEVTGTPGGTDSADLTAEGLEDGALAIAPSPADFGTATVNTTGVSRTFTIENTGGASTGTLTTALSGAHPTDFPIVSGGNGCQGITLSAGATCTISVVFEPSATGDRTASLTVTDTSGGSVSAALSGVGEAPLAPANLVLKPTAHDFGGVPINTSGTFQFTLENTGDETSGTPNLGITGNNFSQFEIVGTPCTNGIAGGNTCTVSVRFTPTSTGDKTASLDVDATPGGSDSSQLQGTGTDTDLSASPTSLSWISGELGHVIVGESASTQVELRNDANATATTGAISTAISGSSSFTIANDNCANSTLAPGQTCTLDVNFAPSTVATGTTADLSIDASPGGSINVSLAGNSISWFRFVEDGTASTLVDAADPIEFASGDAVALGNTQLEDVDVFNNPGNGQKTRQFDAAITAGSSHFSLSSSGTDCGSSTDVAASDFCTVEVEYAPTSTGTLTGELTVTDQDGNAKTIGLTGEGKGPIELADPANGELDFGAVTIGATPNGTFVFQNQSEVATNALNTQFVGNSAFSIVSNECSGKSLSANGSQGDSCTIEVVFYPTAETNYSGSVTVSEIGGLSTTGTMIGEGVTSASLEASTNSHDFGGVIATNSDTFTFSVTNTGKKESGSLTTGSLAAPYSIQNDGCNGTTLAQGESCDIEVAVAPARSTSVAEDVTDSLGVSGSPGGTISVDFSVDIEPMLSVSPAPGDFGQVVAGNTSSAVTFQVTNNGAEDVSTSNLAVGGEFAIESSSGCGTISANGGTCTVDVTFSPPAAVDYQDNLIITGSNSSDTDDASVVLTGEGLQDAVLEFADDVNSDLGFAVEGTTGETRTLTLENVGEADTGTMSSTLSYPTGSSADWNISDGCDGQNLSPGATCTIDVTFTPSATGSASVEVTVDASGVNQPTSDTSLQLSGVGESSTGLVLTPGSYTYSNTLAGETSVARTFTVENTSSSVTALLGITLSNSQFATVNDDCDNGEQLLPGDICSFDVEFTPQSDGFHEAVLTVADGSSTGLDDGKANIFGEGLANAPASLSVSPNSYDFTQIGINDQVVQTFTVSNSGDQSSGSVTTQLLGGTNGGWFQISRDTCASGIAGGASCEIDVTFSPTAQASADNVLEVAWGSGNTKTVNLDGEGVTAAQLVLNSPTTSQPLDCGTIAAGQTSEDCQTLQIENTGQATTSELSVALNGASSFTLDGASDCEGATLASGQTCQIVVDYASDVVASDSVDVDVSASTGGSVSVAIEAEATSALSLDSSNSNSAGFGDQSVGSGTVHTFEFENAANTDATGPLSVSITGANASEFSVVGGTCAGQTLQSSASCTVDVEFVPNSVADDKEATLVVSDGALEKEATVSLTGNGTN